MSILPVGIGSSGGYTIANSLRFRASASAYLNRTFGSPTSATQWTYSTWFKPGVNGVEGFVFLAAANGGANEIIRIHPTTYKFEWKVYNGTSFTFSWESNMLFRDPSAHYHIVFGRANAGGYFVNVNGIDISTQGTLSGTLATYYLNVASRSHEIGRNTAGAFSNGVQSEINFIDGQALGASSFGEQNSDGVWVPKRYTGTYGNNGFKLDFSDGTSTTTLGYDSSGNGNNWTLNNISLTAGATYDWLTDTPTNNYATLNPLALRNLTTIFENGNLLASVPAGSNAGTRVFGSIAFPSSGAYYVEAEFATDTPAGEWSDFGVSSTGVDPLTGFLGGVPSTEWVFVDSGYKRNNNSTTAYGTSQGSTFTLRMAVNMNTGKVWVGDSVGWFSSGDPAAGTNEMYSGLPSTLYPMAVFYRSVATSQNVSFNFGQRPFAYTPPTGFKALCTANMPAVAIPNPRKHFDAKTYTGLGSGSLNVTGLAFQPDFTWIKNRPQIVSHFLTDALRGAGKRLYSDATSAEVDESANFTAFNVDGFTVAGNNSGCSAAQNYISWNWKANGAGVSNTAGSITSTVSANTTAGFSIVTYTGTGVNATVGHGLGVAPKFVIVKQRSGPARSWMVYHSSIGATKYLQLESTMAAGTLSTIWQDTAPTSSVFSIGTDTTVSANTLNFVAYCFAEIPGFSKFGSYTGNGSADGPFVYCGFRPRWIMVKRVDVGSSESWGVFDTARDTYNVGKARLYPNLSDVEYSVGDWLDVTAIGFKIRGTAFNTNTGTYIFAAFAEFPQGGSNVAPAPAR